MGQVKNNFVEFDSEDVAKNILLATDGNLHADNMIKDTSEKSNKQDSKKANSQGSKGNNKKCGNCGKTKVYCKCGRNTVMTDDVIKLLYMAFCMNYSDSQACLYAGIGTTAFYDYQNKNTKFTEHKALLKQTTHMYAKANLFKSLVNGNIDDSKWLLERLEKDTYGKRDTIEQQSTITIRDPLRERLIELKEQKRIAQEQKMADTSQKVVKVVKSGETKAKKRTFKIVKKK